MLFETLETRNLMSATLTTAAAIAATPPTGPAVQATAALSSAQVAYGLTAEQKRVVEQITSTFENSTTTLQYAYIENLHDGRGFTAGRAGFCTGTGDFYEVVRRYTTAKPGNVLAGYLPRLAELADEFSQSWEPVADVSGLSGIESAWRQAAADPAFRAAQDAVVNVTYYQPAMNRARALGLTTALAKGQLYDAVIQHGDGDDPDGLAAMIGRANARTGGSPAAGKSETAWLRNFLAVRRQTLSYATDPDTRAAWAASVGRVDVYSGLLTRGNLGLTGTITFTVYGDTFTVQGVRPTTPPPTAKGSISGTVFFDPNRDGVRNAGEAGSGGRVVFIDTDNDQYLDANEVRTTTDSAGRYRFANLTAGTYRVRLNSTSWSFSTTPIARLVTVRAGLDTANVLFGEARW